ncbi:uncharacterized protein LOC6556941 [Drosophila grimshawi]|uniref:GH16008 n=1 Tax=Drosophila grimshawi TaxID=7222 RepID=B4J2F1_DROGR|nr:uncharacterized protein LOC6556941 [Drosophila grimshawi]EDV96010.1 GH16008 [Drosophila grimshawi]
MARAANFLYMFHFAVDDLVITRINRCAPVEYATCVEITFRNSVYVEICTPQPQCGKCCIFALESPVTPDDRLQIHVYKKRSNKCKFLLGLSELEIYSRFEKVNRDFDIENANWSLNLQMNKLEIPTLKDSNHGVLDRCDCFNSRYPRFEQLSPTSTMFKTMLPLFNLCRQQTGNLVLITRLVAQGPTIVSSFCKLGNKYVPSESSPDQNTCFIRSNDVHNQK